MSRNKLYADYVVDQYMRLDLSSGTDGFASFSELNDPTYLEFLIIPHFNIGSGLLADESHKNSALAYLKRIGETERYEMLKQFISRFKLIMKEGAWMFKSVSGIGEALKRPINQPLLTDGALEFSMFETVDWKLQSLLTLHKTICYDYERMVEILPYNLQLFWMSIYVRDIRVLISDSAGKNSRDFGRTIKNLDIELTSQNHRMFHFGHCKLNIESNASMFDEINSTDLSVAEGSMKIDYKTFQESAKFRTVLGDVEITSDTKSVSSNDIINNDPNFLQKLGTRLQSQVDEVTEAFNRLTDAEYNKTALSNLLDSAEDQAVNLIGGRTGGFINQARLGNVYELDISDAQLFRNLDDSTITKLQDSGIFENPNVQNFRPLDNTFKG